MVARKPRFSEEEKLFLVGEVRFAAHQNCSRMMRDHRGDEPVVIDQRLGASSRKRHNKEAARQR